MNKKILGIIVVVTMLTAMLPIISNASEALMTLEELREVKGAITIEVYNIGQGFLMEPSLYDKEGKSTGDITVDALTRKNIAFQGDTSYFEGFEFNDKVSPVYPEYLEEFSGEFDSEGDGDGFLTEFDYFYQSGWCYTINDWWASWGADSSYPGETIIDYNTGEAMVLGDVIRWHFTLYGLGADCGFPGNLMAEWTVGNLFTQEDKSDLIFILAAINDYYGNSEEDDVYETALAVAANPLATAEEIAQAESTLRSYIENISSHDILLGDPDFNNRITVSDAIVILKHVADITPLEGDALTAANVDKNNVVDIQDACCILRYIARITNQL